MEAATSLDSSSSEDLDNLCIDHEIDDIDISDPPRKPHFLDYDAVPPPGFEDINSVNHNNKILSPTLSLNGGGNGGNNGDGYPGENVKLDKKYERDGEISDYELAASGVTKRELTPKQYLQNNINNNNNNNNNNNHNNHNHQKQTGARKKKHFLDENPIPPDYMLEKDREHRSLDRNFERQQQQHEFVEISSNKYEKKHSSEGETKLLRKIKKEPSYTLSRFIENEIGVSSSAASSSCRGGTWPVERPSENLINYSSMPSENVTNLGPKVECVYSLLSMLGSHDSVEMSKKFLELSRTTETCATLRRSGCIPLLVQMMHSDSDEGARKRAAAALHNVVHCHPDDKAGRREAKVLRLIEQIMDYCNFLKTLLMSGGETIADDSDRHPLAAISSLMKVSFDEEHRHAMCQLGALQAIASLVHLDHAVHGPKPEDQCCNSLRRYALMALTNLTFGDGNNKALLCANKEFMEALVAQLDSAPDDLLQVTASVLRNLSWRADNNMKAVLNEIGTVTALAKAAMKNKNENTLKAILSALWNLSAHCSTNKAEFCAVEGALAFLVDMLTYEGPSKTLKIIENAGGILRNLSSHIAIREDYRKILRQRNCLSILLQQLKSESLTVVSNACGTLWNLSARCPEDQKYLWDNGAVPMLRSLIHSKHKMISEGSSAALKNLLNFRPGAFNQNNMDPIAKAMGLRELPTLNARKQRALEQELNRNLAETCDNLDVITPPKEKEFEVSNNEDDGVDTNKNPVTNTRLTRSAVVSKSESRDSIVSAKSDSIYEKLRRGHSAPPTHESFTAVPKTTSKDKFNVRNNFTVKQEYDVEQVEQPIDYSAKYNNENVAASQKINDQMPPSSSSSSSRKKSQKSSGNRNYPVASEYQETDLDQPTDFSLRYAENQVESDAEEKVTAASASGGNEIILILEDTVKCYQTEGTPYIISNAGSITDLRNPKPEEIIPPTKRMPIKTESTQNYGSGTYTPEKPVNYCEEGTPGYFSRYESLSSLDESPPNCNNTVSKVKPEVLTEEPSPEHKAITEIESQPVVSDTTENAKSRTPPPRSEQQKNSSSSTPGGGGQNIIPSTSKIPINSAQETPLMFSRRSSMDSLASAEPITADDKSSVVSDFSRLASGVISPSELPDSPTQSMPQSPRRNSSSGGVAALPFQNGGSGIGGLSSTSQRLSSTGAVSSSSQRLRSVFEDETNTFLVENTPAQFSCATSLSNLSLDDEPKIASDTIIKELVILDQSPKDTPEDILMPSGNSLATAKSNENVSNSNNKIVDVTLGSCAVSDGEESTNDDILLATCINIGMNKGSSSSKLPTSQSSSNLQNSAAIETNGTTTEYVPAKEITIGEDVIKQYYTEDTPALLSKVGSNSNLSALSVPSTINKNEIVVENANVNLSDESSNTSDGGSDLLEQCIREGMQKTKQHNKVDRSQESSHNRIIPVKDPIAMLRRGGLPPYLPVRDEMSKFVVEDSPCNFSVISGLSNLTVESGVAGPANIKKISDGGDSENKRPPESFMNSERRQNVEDSLSSISIESEDDTNLLSQAIAAGCNKATTKSHSSSKSAAGSSTSAGSKHHHHHRADPHQPPKGINHLNEANDSLSSVDSSDSNDYQAKSLFEQCIRTGMNKQSKRTERQTPSSSGSLAAAHHSQIGNKPVVSPKRSQLPTFAPSHTTIPAAAAVASNTKTPMKVDRDRQRERERKDEQLLRECINTGIAKSVRVVEQQQQQQQQQQVSPQIKPPTKHVRQILAPTDFSQRLVTGGASWEPINQRQQHQFPNTAPINTAANNSITTVPKNGEATSVAVLEQHQLVTITSQSAPSTAPGVEMREPPEGINTVQKNHNLHTMAVDPLHQQIGNTRAQQQQQNITGSDLFETSQKSLNYSGDGGEFMLDQSNEYPALKLSNIDTIDDSVNESSFEMDVSNEFLIEKDDVDDEFIGGGGGNSQQQKQKIIHDKHKDPDLMLKSVERLTQELVSTAEYLRTATTTNTGEFGELSLSSQDFDNNSNNSSAILFDRKSEEEEGIETGREGSNSNSNNTWNEDTCPNDVSFPSVSLTAPMIASLNDDETTISDVIPSHTNDNLKEEENHKILVDKTPTNEIKVFYDISNIRKYVNDFEYDASISHDTFILEREDSFEPNNSQPNSLETETDTLVNDETDGGDGSASSSNKNLNSLILQNSNNSGSGIQFKVGGEVQQQIIPTLSHQFTSSGPMSFDLSLTIANSREAQKIANDLFMQRMSDSTTSLDLDNIRPPSGMESLSISGCYDIPLPPSTTPHSPQLSRLRKKSLPAGLVARRALAGNNGGNGQCGQLMYGGGGGSAGGMSGSVESVNSSCNLDNIKPPSLMDELLDSMISVESITSEIVDNQSINGIGIHNSMSIATNTTNYETAFSDVDDNTTILQSCMDEILPNDDDSNRGTPTILSDFSSAESTPRKGQRKMNNVAAIPGIKRILTPKQKRRIIKDRYKTYTIAADYVLKEDYRNIGNVIDDKQNLDYGEDDEIIRIEIEHEAITTDDEINQIQDQKFIQHLLKTEEEENDDDDNSETILRKTSDLNGGNMSGSVKRRSTDPDRYKTRTIVYNHNVADKDDTIPKMSSHQQNIEPESLTSNDDDTEELSSIRALTKQFKFINSPEPFQQSNDDKKQTSSAIPTINSLIRAKLFEEEKRTITTIATTTTTTTLPALTTVESDYNSMECDQNSETESCVGDQTYDKNNDDEGMSSKKFTQQTKPKITKPNDKDSGTEINCSEDSITPPETVKAVRGRKKPPYVSPYRKSVLSNSSSRTTSPKSQIGNTMYRANLATKNVSVEFKKTFSAKSIPRNQTIVTKTHVLVNKSNLTNKLSTAAAGKPNFGKSSLKNTPINKNVLTEKNLINKTHLNGDVKPKEITSNNKQNITGVTPPTTPAVLERQGTFVKDEPSNAEVPIVSSLPSSPAKTSKLPMKLGSVNGKPSNIPKSPIKTTTFNTSKTRTPLQKPTDTTKSKVQTKQSLVTPSTSKLRLNTSATAATTSSEPGLKKKTTMMIIRKSCNTIAPPQRSNSNTSIRTTPSIPSLRSGLPSTTPPSRSNSNLTSTGINTVSTRPIGVSSRIAGIWKKTDDCKKPGQQQTTTVQANKKISGKPPVNNNGGVNNKSKLTRSSTFDSGSTGTVDETLTTTQDDQNYQKHNQRKLTVQQQQQQQQQRKTEISACNTGTFLIRRSKNPNQKTPTIDEPKTLIGKRTFRFEGNSLRAETNC